MGTRTGPASASLGAKQRKRNDSERNETMRNAQLTLGAGYDTTARRSVARSWLVRSVLISLLTWLAGPTPAAAQDKPAQDNPAQEKSSQGKPAIVVEAFTAAADAAWPYEWKQLQTETIAELQAKYRRKYSIGAEAPGGGATFYRLQGEVLEWRPGNKAKRALVGMGSGREMAKIHYWLVTDTGRKVFEHTDIIRAELFGNVYESSVGELAHPFADKIAKRLSEAKLE